MRIPTLLIALLLATGPLACDMIQMHGTMVTTVTKNGQTTVKERHFKSLDELPGALKEAGGDLSEVTTELKKVLIDAPPAGRVKLGSLMPELAKYEGDKRVDFIANGLDADGKPIDFSYVQIGVASYDNFFKTAMEMYALAFQARQTVHRLREVSSGIKGLDKVDDRTELDQLIAQAEAVGGNASNTDDLETLRALKSVRSMTAGQVITLASKTKELVAAGQGLVAGAPTSVTNPKMAIHIKLIVEGLKKSVSVVRESGSLLGQLAKES